MVFYNSYCTIKFLRSLGEIIIILIVPIINEILYQVDIYKEDRKNQFL